MSDQHLLAKAPALSPRSRNSYDLGRNARKVAPLFAVFRAEDKGHEAWPALHDAQAELLGQSIAKPGCAHLRDGEATGGDNHGLGLKQCVRCVDLKLFGADN